MKKLKNAEFNQWLLWSFANCSRVMMTMQHTNCVVRT